MSKPSQPNSTESVLPTTTIGNCDTEMSGNVMLTSSEEYLKTFKIIRKQPGDLLVSKGQKVKQFRPPQTGYSIYSHNDHRLWCTINFSDFTYHGAEKIQAATFECNKGVVDVRTMENIINLIGIEKHKVLMHALMSITDEDLRKKSVAALLTPRRDKFVVAPALSKTYRDAASMTDDNGIDMFSNSPKNKCKNLRSRRRQLPYIIAKEPEVIKVRKTVIDPFACLANINEKLWKSESKSLYPSVEDQLDSNLQMDLDNFSDCSNKISKAASLGSFNITPSIINDNESLAHELATRVTKTDPDEEESLLGLTIDDSDDIETPQKREPFHKKCSNIHVYNQANSSIMHGQKRHNDSLNEFKQIKRSHLDAGLALSEAAENFAAFNSTASPMEMEGLGKFNKHRLGRLNSIDSVCNLDGKIDGSQNLMQGIQREDLFHLATPKHLKTVSLNDINKRLKLQMYIDWKLCLEADDDDNLPIHNAVLNNDMDLLKRQCLVLKARNQSIDIGDANLNLSALQMCVARGADPELARELLRRGASPLAPDDEERSALHHAAEATSHDYILLLLEHMATESREILKAESLWSPEMDEWKQQQLLHRLFWHALTNLDKNGYTPLMVAARCGHGEHVYDMLERIANSCSEIVNFQAPNSGNTALYVAVEAACHMAEKAGNTSQIADKFAKVIENLIRYGADPWIENNYGATSNTLVAEYEIQHLSIIMNNAMSQTKLGDVTTVYDYFLDDGARNEKQITAGNEPFIIIKTEDGLFYEKNKKFDLSSSKRNKTQPTKLEVDSLPSSIQNQINNSLGNNSVSIKTTHTNKSDVNINERNKTKYGPLIGETNSKWVGSPITSETPKVSSTVESKIKPVILQDIQLKNASDYIKNCQIKPIKVKVLPKNTITAGTSKVPHVNDNTNTLKKPHNIIKIPHSNFITISGTQNVTGLTHTFVNSYGQNITLVKGANKSTVYKVTSAINDGKTTAINSGRNVISKLSANKNVKEKTCNSIDKKLKSSVTQDVPRPKVNITEKQVAIAPISNNIPILKPQSSSNEICKVTNVPDQNIV